MSNNNDNNNKVNGNHSHRDVLYERWSVYTKRKTYLRKIASQATVNVYDLFILDISRQFCHTVHSICESWDSVCVNFGVYV